MNCRQIGKVAFGGENVCFIFQAFVASRGILSSGGELEFACTFQDKYAFV
jgi:hypothetical protein